MYLEAAKESADFIRNQLYNSGNVVLVQDGLSARKNDSCELNSETVQQPYNSGLAIEGLAILYSITQNASIYYMIGELVAAAIPYSGWQGPNGVMFGDVFLPRALATVYARNATTPTLQAYIAAYLSVQVRIHNFAVGQLFDRVSSSTLLWISQQRMGATCTQAPGMGRHHQFFPRGIKLVQSRLLLVQ
ncbi:hypothetical protein B0H19DRAFT_1151691 [Mycena capillaripes]|nr:hypothetical protein B0H19DRAFT_1151691 [Mycena capillaripes]